MKFDNKGLLKNAPNDTVRQNIIQSRIKHLTPLRSSCTAAESW